MHFSDPLSSFRFLQIFLISLLSSLLVMIGFVLLPELTGAAGQVGSGTPSSCTEAAFNAALAAPGTITFNCGGPATITLTDRVEICGGTWVVDGGNQITLARNLNSAKEFNLFRLNCTTNLEFWNITLTGGMTTSTATAARGGAINVAQNASLKVLSSTIISNGAFEGGGIYSAGEVIIRDSTILSNTSINDGGGVRMAANLNSSLAVVNSTFAYNFSDDQGGAIASNITTTTSIMNSTFAYNTATSVTGGVYIFKNATVAITDSLLVSNRALTLPDHDSGNCHFGSNVITTTAGNWDDINGSCGNNASSTLSSFIGPLEGNGGPTPTFALLAGNPAIDSAVSCRDDQDLPLTTDQRGLPRPEGSGCDVGAFELTAPPPIPSIAFNGSATVDEGAGSVSLAVTLSEAVSAPVTVTVTTSPDNGTALAGSDYSALAGLTVIVPANNISSSFTVNITDDGFDEFDEIFTATLTSPVVGAIISPTNDTAVVTISDNDIEPIVSINSQSMIEPTNPEIMQFTVSLSAISGKAISVNYATSNTTATAGADYTAEADTLIFAAGELTKSLAIEILPDSDDENNETFTVNLSNPVNVTLSGISGTGTIIDDDQVGSVVIQETESNTAVNEDGLTDTYQIVLAEAPTADVTITVTPDNQVSVGAGENAPIALIFTTLNWNLPQTVTVTAIDDGLVEGGHIATLTHSATSADSSYNNVTIDNLIIIVTDNDTSGAALIQESGNNTVATEGGITDIYTLQLVSQPTSNAQIMIDPDNQLDVGSGPGTPLQLTFTLTNWDIAQTVTVTAVDDALPEETPHPGTIIHTIVSSDTAIDGLAIPALVVDISDNDFATVTVIETAGTLLAEGAATDTYQLVLSTAPVADVVITVTPDNQVSVGRGGDVPISVTFTPANWNVPQTIDVSAVDDGLPEGGHTGTIIHTAISTDPNYNDTVISMLTALITDNDTFAATITESGSNTSVTESGVNDTYQITLATAPTANVTITIDPNADLDLGAGPDTPITLIFTPANWNSPQLVNVRAVDDTAKEPQIETSIIVHTLSSVDANFDGALMSNVTVLVVDNDSGANLYLPMVSKAGQNNQVDLEVVRVTPTATGVTVVIKNSGQASITKPFWVDLYLNPTEPPTINKAWQQIAPHGAVWGINTILNPNDELILTIGDLYFDGASSNIPTTLMGSTIWVQVDSIDYSTSVGRVAESDEGNNLFGPIVP